MMKSRVSVSGLRQFRLSIDYETRIAGAQPQPMYLFVNQSINPIIHRSNHLSILSIHPCIQSIQLPIHSSTPPQDAKCSWLVVRALELCTEEQRQILEQHYGKQCEHSVADVKRLFEQLNLKEQFNTYEDESHLRIVELIDVNANGSGIPKGLFVSLVQKIYKRKK